ncbi:MAG: CsbD family protein [Anaerolineales bacterium]|nr:CsbD family protein [Anaerolineales bacterium]
MTTTAEVASDVAANVKSNVKSNVKTLEQQIKQQVGKKRQVVDGKVTQAKGLAQEKIGELTNNNQLRRTGRRTQLKGKLRERGITFPGSKALMAIGTAVALVAAYFFFRTDSEAAQAS